MDGPFFNWQSVGYLWVTFGAKRNANTTIIGTLPLTSSLYKQKTNVQYCVCTSQRDNRVRYLTLLSYTYINRSCIDVIMICNQEERYHDIIILRLGNL
jgi:hypothetical protein